MKIRYHVAVDNRLQRSVVELDNHNLARRIVHLMSPHDGGAGPNLEPALWQELTHWGEYHNVYDTPRAAELERQFLAELIANKDTPAPMKDAHGAWRHDAKRVLNS